MIRRESKASLIFRHWMRANPQITSSFEMKQSETESIPFSCVAQEQIDYALAIESDKGVLMRTQGETGQPDYIYMRNEPAYFVIKYPSSMHLIRINEFIAEKERSIRKSLTSERARAISYRSVDL